VLSLTPTPPANAFVPRERLEERQAAYPLDVHLCRGCGHAQLLDVVDPQILFRDYVYVSGTSPVFVEHFRRYADSVAELAGAGPGSLAVDIGSNDGTLLRFLRDRGMRVLGVDPAREIARRATESGIETLPVFFTAELARKLRGERGPARLIAANNVFAHADDLGDIADGVRALLERDGVFVFEVSYLGDVLENTLFDTIYHEHLSYHSLKPLPGFFRAHGLQVFDAQRVPTHGGSLRCMVQRDDGGRAVSPAVAALVAEEARKGLDRPETFERFAAGIGAVKDALTALLRRIRAEGGRVAGYGAPAKATTLLYHFDLGGALDFIVDDSPLKQGLYSPGFHIPVVGSQALAEKRPDYLLILAWNFAAPIMERCRDYGKAGGRFIVPLPKCEVLPR
jgi:SAM-dependent methyltransferase